jgi:glutaminase
LRLVNEGAIKINRMIERRENEMKKRYFCSCKQEMRNHVKKTQILRKLVGSVDQKKKHEAVKQLKMNLYCKRELQKSKKYF